MEYNYTVFNPATSKVADELLNLPISILFKRYIKVKTNSSKKFFDIVKELVNEVDDEEYLINPFLFDREGSNLNYVANQVFVFASKLKQLGYEFKLENIMRDLDRLFGEHANEVDKMTKDSKVLPISKEISYFYVTEILTNRLFKTLENAKTAPTTFEQ